MTKWLVAFVLVAAPVWAQPQTPSGAGQTATLQNAATGNANGTVLFTTNLSVAVLTVNCSACSSTTINFEGTQNGTNYTPITATQVGTTITGTTTTTAGVTVWTFSVAGLTNVRARISSYSAGTVTITGRATAAGSISSGGGSAGDVTIHDPAITTQKVAVNASGQMSITCANCSGSGASAVDRSTWTFGATSLAPGGGAFDDSPPADLTAGMVGIFRMTPKRGIHVNFRNQAGTEIATLANPLRTDPTGTTTQPVSGTVSASNFPATADTNIGAAGTSTLRTVAANDTDPCRSQANTKAFVAITQTATTQLLGLAGSSKKYYICSVNIVTATAQNVALIDSTTAGNACATSPAGLDGFGGSTAATGWNFAANGGIAYGNGGYALGASHDANAALCVAQSGTGQLSGGVGYVIQ